MSYAELEAEGGSPFELYQFTYGERVWRFTSADRVFVVDSNSFYPTVLRRGNLNADEEARSGSTDITVEAENEIAQLFAKSLPTMKVMLTIWRAQRDDPDEEAAVIFTGEVKNCTFTKRTAALHCVPMRDVVSRKLPQLEYQTNCNNMLFDNRCQVNRDDFTFSHDIVDIISVRSSVGLVTQYTLDPDAFSYFVDDNLSLLKDGLAKFGDVRVSIVYHEADVIWTLVPIEGAVIGDTLELTAGCPKTVEACRDRFSNLPRFMGFPHIPQRNPFDGVGGLT